MDGRESSGGGSSDAEGPGEKEQGRRRERAPGSDKAPQVWEERRGQGQDLRVPSNCCESIGIQSKMGLTGRGGSVGRTLWHKSEDSCSNPQDPCKTMHVVCVYNAIILLRDERQKQELAWRLLGHLAWYMWQTARDPVSNKTEGPTRLSPDHSKCAVACKPFYSHSKHSQSSHSHTHTHAYVCGGHRVIDSGSGNAVVFSGQSRKEDGAVTGARGGDGQNPGRRGLQPFQSLVEESDKMVRRRSV